MAALYAPGARAASEDVRTDVPPLWGFTVLNYAAVGSGRALEKLSYPTREACEAARQAVVEIGQEQRPIPVVGRCLNAERRTSLPSG